MTYKKKANKEIVEEVNDLKLEKEEQRQKRLEAESEWARDYEEQFRKDQQREEEVYLARQQFESYIPESDENPD